MIEGCFLGFKIFHYGNFRGSYIWQVFLECFELRSVLRGKFKIIWRLVRCSNARLPDAEKISSYGTMNKQPETWVHIISFNPLWKNIKARKSGMDFFGDLILIFFQIRVNILESKMYFSSYSVQKVSSPVGRIRSIFVSSVTLAFVTAGPLII